MIHTTIRQSIVAAVVLGLCGADRGVAMERQVPATQYADAKIFHATPTYLHDFRSTELELPRFLNLGDLNHTGAPKMKLSFLKDHIAALDHTRFAFSRCHELDIRSLVKLSLLDEQKTFTPLTNLTKLELRTLELPKLELQTLKFDLSDYERLLRASLTELYTTRYFPSPLVQQELSLDLEGLDLNLQSWWNDVSNFWSTHLLQGRQQPKSAE